MAAHGVWVSEHLGLRTTEYIEGALKDRFENSVHVDLLANLVKPTNARVLEVRPRPGTIAESLRRLYNANVSVMPMWESQKFLLKELYGFDAQGLIDYDHFRIPFEGRFNLIVCNHIIVHSVRPSEFLREVHAHLNPGGLALSVQRSSEDRQVLEEGKSIIAHLNPLHMQTFDSSAMVRALAANGFEVTFIKARNSSFLVLARAAEETGAWTPISPADSRSGSRRIDLLAIGPFCDCLPTCVRVLARNGPAPSSTVSRAAHSSSTIKGSCASRSNELAHHARAASSRPLAGATARARCGSGARSTRASHRTVTRPGAPRQDTCI